MAIIKKTTVVAKPAAKPAAKVAAKPVVKATVTKVMTDSKTGKATKSAPVAMKSKSITAKEFNADKKAGYGDKQFRDDSIKVRKSINTIDSIDKSSKKPYDMISKAGYMDRVGKASMRNAKDSAMYSAKYDEMKKDYKLDSIVSKYSKAEKRNAAMDSIMAAGSRMVDYKKSKKK
jgi:hypothetical protein